MRKPDLLTRLLGAVARRLTALWLRRMARCGRFPEVTNVRLAPSRNAPCPCGSGRKLKHCCGGPSRR